MIRRRRHFRSHIDVHRLPVCGERLLSVFLQALALLNQQQQQQQQQQHSDKSKLTLPPLQPQLHALASSHQFGRTGSTGPLSNTLAGNGNGTNNNTFSATSAPRMSVRFERYMQSNRCRSFSDSCVSFASAVVYATPKHAETVAALSAVHARRFAAQRYGVSQIISQ